ncbi:hypothetical protein Q8A67_002936 [Cirrhinus molitorella]|uniref:Uncharacterized protein n=1 Tax=Cirrhinus molitorella TaxID=172907 RepID=A0AA88U451_9TELE|nr:hypothetical protein Q8A67_002936 [Cirrhinus molitorella]
MGYAAGERESEVNRRFCVSNGTNCSDMSELLPTSQLKPAQTSRPLQAALNWSFIKRPVEQLPYGFIQENM